MYETLIEWEAILSEENYTLFFVMLLLWLRFCIQRKQNLQSFCIKIKNMRLIFGYKIIQRFIYLSSELAPLAYEVSLAKHIAQCLRIGFQQSATIKYAFALEQDSLCPSFIYISQIQMKNSYYSNLNTSKLSTKLIEDTCMEHEGEPFTNFCSAATCIKPLCPECIENHYNHHKNIRTPPEIDSFKTLKNKCISKIADILQHIGEENDTSPNELLTIFDTSIRKVKEVRDQCRKLLDSYFLNLEEFIKKKMNKLTAEESELIAEVNRVNNIIAELKLLLNKLDNNRSFLNSAETIIKLDGDKIQQKVKEGVQTIFRFKQNHKTNLYIEKNFEHKVYNFLANTFFYGNKDNLETMPKIADQIKSKTAMENLSRSHSRNKEDMSVSKEPKYEKRPSLRDNQFEGASTYERRKEEDERSNLSRKSSKKNLKKSGKEIIGMNTFSNNSPRRYLHFFQHDQNILHYLDLDSGSQFQTINLNLNFKLPDFHKSISISNGDLFLIAGADSNAPQKKVPNIYKYDFQNNTLQLVNKLKYGRSSHSICFNNRYIYVLGGYLNNQNLTNRCERYDIVSNRVEQLRPMHYSSCSFACCSFSGRYIYKFGGVGQNNEIIHNIERFDEKTGMWEEVNPSLDIPKGQRLESLSTSAATQITKNQIMVIGGYDENNTGYKQTYILRIQDSGETSIRDLNVYPLPVAQAFWNNNPIIHQKMVFALQNVSTGENDCSQSVRRILSFDGREWKEL